MLILYCIITALAVPQFKNIDINTSSYQHTHESVYAPLTRNVGCGDAAVTRATWFSVTNTSPEPIAVSVQFYNEFRVLNNGILSFTVISTPIGKNSQCLGKYNGTDKLTSTTFTLHPTEKVYITHHATVNGKDTKKSEWLRIRATPAFWLKKGTLVVKPNYNDVKKLDTKTSEMTNVTQLVKNTDKVLSDAHSMIKSIKRETLAKITAQKVAEDTVHRYIAAANKRPMKPIKVALVKRTRTVKLGQRKYRASRLHFDELISFEDQQFTKDSCNPSNMIRAKFYTVDIPAGKKLRVNTCHKATEGDVKVDVLVGDKCREVSRYKCRRMKGEVVQYVPTGTNGESVVVRVSSSMVKAYAFVKIDALNIVKQLSKSKREKLEREGKFRFGGFWAKQWGDKTKTNSSTCKQCQLIKDKNGGVIKSSEDCKKCPVLVNNNSLKKGSPLNEQQKSVAYDLTTLHTSIKKIGPKKVGIALGVVFGVILLCCGVAVIILKLKKKKNMDYNPL
ncbi:hypothetical protein EIN_074380 [Entamoeba invadens IP1]|uniref:Uncharacterized protein n=1 Tax=Entamoeba invadens IP1 TaxID=370355 RepID=A0A0A1UBJ1_ENTIV|nr:hypothetical protein EIN_074380 [Entamoeba invadens IP1]ELP92595.1 hypothetical protein EIN_074380 [Entamoeba invadens IP1]|eukprot:XP_004259366.1 hypothetical protein EIN_074380 [Entamoeba invadens IP1]